MTIKPLTLHPCPARQCDRLVKYADTYCCEPCRTAWESTPRYEPHTHTSSCDERHAERGSNPWI